MAADLGLAPNTVARAYRELEASGILDTRGRAGTFVTGDETSRAARQAASEYVQRVRALGLPRRHSAKPSILFGPKPADAVGESRGGNR